MINVILGRVKDLCIYQAYKMVGQVSMCKMYLFQSLLEYFKIIHPLDSKSVVNYVSFVHHNDKWKLSLVQNTVCVCVGVGREEWQEGGQGGEGGKGEEGKKVERDLCHSLYL